MAQGLPKEYFARRLVREFGCQKAYQAHLRAYGEVLGHVLFGNEVNPILVDLLRENTDKETIWQYIGLLEDMYANGDGDVRNILEVTILERLGDEETVLRNAFSYFSEGLMELSKRVEAGWGRRNIHIWHKNGKTLYGWEPPVES